MCALVALGFFAAPSWVEADDGGTVEVRVTNLSNAKGTVLCSVFASSDGFPSTHTKAVKKGEAKISGGQATLVFKGLPPGDYAVAAFHDENGNKKLDKSFIGAPTEGWGVSRNPPPKLRAPRWSEAKFDLPDGGTRKLNLKLNY